MARIPLSPLTAAAEAVRQRLDAARTGVDGLVPTLLPHPDLAEALLELDRRLDDGSVLSPAVREVVALQAAAGLRCGSLWAVHRRRAEAAGVPPSLVLAIETAEAWTASADEPRSGDAELTAPAAAAVRATVAVVLATGTLDDDLQARVLDAVGLDGLLEVVVRTGRHRTLAGLVFALDEPLPPGVDDPWGRLRP